MSKEKREVNYDVWIKKPYFLLGNFGSINFKAKSPGVTFEGILKPSLSLMYLESVSDLVEFTKR